MIREITEKERENGYGGSAADEDALLHMRRMWAENPDPVKYPAK